MAHLQATERRLRTCWCRRTHPARRTCRTAGRSAAPWSPRWRTAPSGARRTPAGRGLAPASACASTQSSRRPKQGGRKLQLLDMGSRQHGCAGRSRRWQRDLAGRLPPPHLVLLAVARLLRAVDLAAIDLRAGTPARRGGSAQCGRNSRANMRARDHRAGQQCAGARARGRAGQRRAAEAQAGHAVGPMLLASTRDAPRPPRCARRAAPSCPDAPWAPAAAPGAARSGAGRLTRHIGNLPSAFPPTFASEEAGAAAGHMVVHFAQPQRRGVYAAGGKP
jgi:hypothetical protein